MTKAGAMLVEDDGPRHADAIVTLGGDEFAMRLLTAAHLASEGYAPIVFVSYQAFGFDPECYTPIRTAERAGYPASLFKPLLNYQRSTQDETQVIGQRLREQHIHSILLVTSNYHTRRAAKDMRDANPWLRVFVVPAPDKYFRPDTWWKTRDGRKIFVMEWTKTFATDMGE